VECGVGGSALAADSYRGWFDVDFVTDPSGRLAPLEINLRLTHRRDLRQVRAAARSLSFSHMSPRAAVEWTPEFLANRATPDHPLNPVRLDLTMRLDVDPRSPVPAGWIGHASRLTGLPPPTVDLAVLDARRAVFPLHGLHPHDPRD
jgi:hypothetical protein